MATFFGDYFIGYSQCVFGSSASDKPDLQFQKARHSNSQGTGGVHGMSHQEQCHHCKKVEPLSVSWRDWYMLSKGDEIMWFCSAKCLKDFVSGPEANRK